MLNPVKLGVESFWGGRLFFNGVGPGDGRS